MTEARPRSGLRSLFDLVDVNSDGLVSPAEIVLYSERVDGDERKNSPFPEQERMKRLETMAATYIVDGKDINSNAAIDWEEWRTAFSRLETVSDSSMVAKTGKRDEIWSIYPQQIHLALTTDPSEMVVMWITSVESVNSTVEYGLNSLTLSANGTSDTYNAGVFGWSGRIHKVILKGLGRGQTYQYRVGDAVQGAWSDLYWFRTEAANQQNAKIAVFGDMGTTIPLGFEVTDQMIGDDASIHFDLITHVGDIAYAGVSHSWEFEYIWDLWGEQVAPLSNHIPYMTSVGNHEKYYNFTSFIHRFHMPGEQSGGLGNFYFSFDYGGIHFTSMSTEDYENSYAPGSPQYAWIQQDLAKANNNRKQTPWIVVLGHRPMYSSDKSTDSGPLQQYIEPLLHRYKVDLAIWGHMHCYERTYPVYNNVPSQTSGKVFKNVNGTIHLTIGTAGAMSDEAFVQPPPSWSAARIGTVEDVAYGYGYLHKLDAKSLYFQFRKWDTGDVFDDFWLVKD